LDAAQPWWLRSVRDVELKTMQAHSDVNAEAGATKAPAFAHPLCGCHHGNRIKQRGSY